PDFPRARQSRRQCRRTPDRMRQRGDVRRNTLQSPGAAASFHFLQPRRAAAGTGENCRGPDRGPDAQGSARRTGYGFVFGFNSAPEGLTPERGGTRDSPSKSEGLMPRWNLPNPKKVGAYSPTRVTSLFAGILSSMPRPQ